MSPTNMVQVLLLCKSKAIYYYKGTESKYVIIGKQVFLVIIFLVHNSNTFGISRCNQQRNENGKHNLAIIIIKFSI